MSNKIKQLGDLGQSVWYDFIRRDMLRSGERIMGYEMKGFWTDLGTHERYERFGKLLEESNLSMERFTRGCGTDP